MNADDHERRYVLHCLWIGLGLLLLLLSHNLSAEPDDPLDGAGLTLQEDMHTQILTRAQADGETIPSEDLRMWCRPAGRGMICVPAPDALAQKK